MAKRIAEHQLENSRILIVDDNSMNLQVLGKILMSEHFKVEFAVSGEAALEWLNSSKFDIVLLDINMPGLSGFDVCKIIRNNAEWDEMPVIFISALDDRDSVFKGFELGAQDYISKPFDSRELIMRVKTHLSLKKSKEELKNINQTLELKVAERTAKLSQAYEDLNDINKELTDAKEAADAGNRLKSAFIQNISHEIRTPLNGILGFAGFIVDEEIDIEERKTYVEAINRSSERLIKTVTDYLDIALLESKTIKHTPKVFQLSQLLRKLYKEYADIAHQNNLSFQLNIPSHLEDSVVYADEDLIGKAISHVLDNSFKYTNQGEIKIDLGIDESKAIVKISDSGIGIETATIEHVFDTFSKGERDVKKAIDGNGLGLSISSKILQLYNGKIAIQSKPDMGTQVFLSLGSIKKADALVTQIGNHKEKLNHILVAEDDDMNFLFLEIILGYFNVKITRAHNGQEAVELFHQFNDIDLILMDIMMPVMDGLDAMKIIRKNNKEVIIIGVSAYKQPGSAGKALEIGANNYISKPISKTLLFDMISEYFFV
jgi:DNA-binding response OmpR family regulator/anti-sigma regulatory factor (Ser/Thr protein kinase)